MSLTSYYNIIKTFGGEFLSPFNFSPSVEKQLHVLENMSSDKLYVENVRSFFNLSRHNAERLCEQGVKEKLFIKKVGLLCPIDKQIIFSGEKDDESLPEKITCSICYDLDRETYEYETKYLDRLYYYTLDKK